MILPLSILPLLLAVAAPPTVPQFVAQTADASKTGFLQQLDSHAQAVIGEAPAFPLVELRQVERARPDRPRVPLLLLSNGDVIPATVQAGDRRSVRVTPTIPGLTGETWTVPLTAFAAVWLVPPPVRMPMDPARYPWRTDARRQDAVLLRNGDVVPGTLESLGESHTVRLVTRRTQPPRVIPLEQVAAVAFDPTLSRHRKPKGVALRVTLTDGSRVTLTQAGSDGRTLTGHTGFGQQVSFPLAQVAAVDVLGGRAVYLSDLKPKSATTEPFLDLSWPWQADRSVKGNPLRIPGPWGIDHFDKGIGTHPRTRLVYDLAGRYRRLEAVLGLDPVTGRRGVAEVQILVDGKPWHGPHGQTLTAATSPVAVNADVTGVRELTLFVDFGPAGGVQADVNWGNARLIE